MEHTIEGKNKLVESINLFNKIMEETKLKNVGKVLLLNKCDLFEEQIKTRDIRMAFPQAPPEAIESYDASTHFITEQFLAGISEQQSKCIRLLLSQVMVYHRTKRDITSHGTHQSTHFYNIW